LKAAEQQLIRSEAAFGSIGLKPEAGECLGMKGILAECDKVIADTSCDTMVRDAALSIVAQKAKHYEISAYGSLISLAQTMEMTEAAAFLSKTPEGEKRSDQVLTESAGVRINKEAALLQ
jgi:ferritin-like metal-binding protein YciE